ncbi:uncharacterized protein LOC116775773 isoform X2 [Danaus plexippus]|uniref:uncharacterized protein LOC116775773 isoform X2 n=1 Tax=Danaus plexippus TaxID=13037 RepID=UPI002AAFE959|nr:uncharacterized protein LOC116775773 isoform X2 [Danaus plexippus]
MSVTMPKRWYRSRRNQIVIIIFIAASILYYISLSDSLQREQNLDITRRYLSSDKGLTDRPLDLNNRQSVIEYIEKRLEQSLKLDKGSGCEIPRLDPFAKEVTQFDKDIPKVMCLGTDWVKCYHSKCRVVPKILSTTKDIVCSYQDIIYESDLKYTIGPPVEVRGDNEYVLTKSDHVKIKCSGKHRDSILPSKWTGHSIGFRSTVHPELPPPGREDSLNVLILGFDSTAKNGFIRRMPKSYKVLKEILGATILNGYNIVGDGTPAALFPILTGKTELELPDVRKKMKNNRTLDSMPFIFYKLKDEGYRTAYFEDMPWIGTFQYRFNGFRNQPADHYLRAFYLEESSSGKKWWKASQNKYCVGDTPQYKLMLDITDQFLRLDGKRFAFTFIADITHDDFNMISIADEDTAEYLRRFHDRYREDTLLIVMGDHGPRYAKVRDTLQGKLEERLPLMAIRLPDKLTKSRPEAEKNLKNNAEVLTTPHDIYATVLDVMDLTQFTNPYKVKGADLTRGLSLLEPIPKNRSCSEAGVEAHWCSCLSWQNVSDDDVMFSRTAAALVDFINHLTEERRSVCAVRTLKSVSWVMRARPNSGVLTFVEARDQDGYVGKFGNRVKQTRENYQLKIAVGPGHGIYEALVTYVITEDRFEINTREISRTNAYNNEPSCISDTHPHLNMYCYCRH